MDILSSISTILKPLSDIVDEVSTTDEERLKLKNELFKLQTEFASKTMEYEAKIAEAQAKIIVAESQSESILTRNWRPITILSLVLCVILVGLGLMSFTQMGKIPSEFWNLLYILLGVTSLGRSIEKTIGK